MEEVFQFEVNVSIDRVDIGDWQEGDLEHIAAKIQAAVAMIGKPGGIGEDYNKVFLDELFKYNNYNYMDLAREVNGAIYKAIENGKVIQV